MEKYYRRRAEEYEEIYHRDDPVRREELQILASVLRKTLKGRKVLEIACGTGYWTQILSKTAHSIVAIDFAQEMLEIAKRKHYECPVSFCKEDAYALAFKESAFNGGLANFWFSHIPKSKIDRFMQGFHRILQSGSKVFIADNVYVPGVGGTLVLRKGEEDTYKLRKLKNGSEHLILKNYFSSEELVEIFSKYDSGFDRKSVFYGKCFWCVTYQVQKATP
ncbi:MAG: class I SAM-dependent methyltransferase [Candidatus Bathyarchaeota archaeon]|jgi:ubiquinone/menaquinone biosynthesis C-methylase UbiE|nr:methyltransferase domain-containing protein [Candidatus Bathyarchaeota archaeon A05DMB-5]MDH7558366.1 class I SAM-dependent methyltransferase [Candidatus Bathyarchaeota archaeon]